MKLMKKAGQFLLLAVLTLVGAGVYGMTTQVATQDELNAAVAAAAAGDVIEITAAGTYKVPSPTSAIKIVGVDGVVFSAIDANYGQSVGQATGTEFVNVKFAFGNSLYTGFQHSSYVAFTKCSFTGRFNSYGEMHFTECSFEAPGGDYSMWLYAGNTYFKDCTFSGDGKFFNIYNEGNATEPWIVEFDGCTFSSSKSNKAALNVKSTCGAKGLKYDVTVNNCKIDPNGNNFPSASTSDSLIVFNGLIQLDDINASVPNEITIKQDGVTLYANNAVVETKKEIEVVTPVVSDEKGITQEIINQITTNPEVAKVEETGLKAALAGDETLKDRETVVKVELTKVAKDGSGVLTYEIKPVVKGETETDISAKVVGKPITFRVPLTDAFSDVAKVTHKGTVDEISRVKVQGAAGSRYVELTFNHFSEAEFEPEVWPDVVKYGDKFYASIDAALEDVRKRTTDDVTITCKPGATIPVVNAHTYLDTSVTISGNGAAMASGWEPDLGTYFDYTGSKRTIEIRNLGKVGIWGSVDAGAQIDILVEGCQDVHEVQIQGGNAAAVVNTFVRNCTFDMVNGCAHMSGVSQDCGGSVLVEGCSFTGLLCGVNVKNDFGTLTTTVKDCTFVDCGLVGNEHNEGSNTNLGAPIRVGSKAGATNAAIIQNNTISSAAGSEKILEGDVIIGDNRPGKDAAGEVTYTVSGTAAKVDVYPVHGKLSGDEATAFTKDAGKSVVLTDAQTAEGDNNPAVAKIGETTYPSLQAAVNAAHEMTGDVTIELLEDVAERVVVHQKEGLNLTIDGKDKARTITGQILVDGNGRFSGTDTLTITGVNFTGTKADLESNTDAFVYVPSAAAYLTGGKYNYAHNVTIENCSFTGDEANPTSVVAFKCPANSGMKNLVMDHVTATKVHSLAQLTGVTNAEITDCTLTDAKNGVNISGGEGAYLFADNTFSANTAEGCYGIRLKDSTSAVATLKDGNTITAANPLVLGEKAMETGNKGQFVVEGGTYNGTLSKGTTSADASYAISGGTFSEAPSADFLADGFEVVANENGTYGVEEVKVAQIGETKYATLAAAVAAVPADGTATTITMIANETINGNTGVTIPAGKNIVLDLNGKTITGTVTESATAFVIDNYGTLTVKDGAEGGKITNAIAEGVGSGDPAGGRNWCNNIIRNNGSLTLEGGLIENTVNGSACYAVDCNSAGGHDIAFTMTGGTLRQVNYTPLRLAPTNTKSVTAEISGGTIEGTYGIVINANSSTAPQVSLAVTGGTIKAKDYALYQSAANNVSDKSKVSISVSGGTWGNGAVTPGEELLWVDALIDAGFITGGTFSAAVPEAYCAEGYIPAFDAETGKYGVKEGSYVAQIGTVKYETLADAFAAATAEDTVKLLQNISAAQTLADAKGTLDLNGRVIETESGTALKLTGATALTLVDSSEDQTGAVRGQTALQLEVGADATALTIRGGSFEGAKSLRIAKKNKLKGEPGACTVAVSGGRFIGELESFGSSLNGAFTGGQFGAMPNADYPADGYQARQIAGSDPAMYEICFDWFATVTDGEGNVSEFATFAEAVAAAQAGDTVTPLKNIMLESAVQIGKKMTLNLSTFTVTAAEGCNAFELLAGCELTVNADATNPGHIVCGEGKRCIYADKLLSAGKKFVTINGGVFDGVCEFNEWGAAHAEQAQGSENNCRVTINGGLFNDEVLGYRCYPFVVNGGTFEKRCECGTTSTFYSAFKGGKFKVEPGSNNPNAIGIGNDSSKGIRIFDAVCYEADGYFHVIKAADIPEGAVAKVGTTCYYMNLADALAKALTTPDDNRNTITLLKGVDVTGLTQRKGIVIAPNGQTVTGVTTSAEENCFVSYDENGNMAVFDESEAVAQIGETKFAVLAASIAAVPADGTPTTITMIADVTIDGNTGVTVPAGCNITLDLNGKTITGNVTESATAFVIDNYGTLTVKDGAEGGKITNTIAEGVGSGDPAGGRNWCNNIIRNNGNLTLESGLIENTVNGSACYAVDCNSAGGHDIAFTMTGGTLRQVNYTPLRLAPTNTKSVTAEISGGTIEGKYGIVINANSSTAPQVSLTVTDGTIKAKDYAFYESAANNVADTANVQLAISGGTWGDGEVTAGEELISISKLGDKFISGGTFTSAVPEAYCAAGYIPTALDTDPVTYGVKEGSYAAKIGEQKYETLAEAIAAAEPGETVTLLRDETVDAVVSCAKAITIDGAGFTLRAATENWTGNYLLSVTGDGTTVKNLTLDGEGRSFGLGLLEISGGDKLIQGVTMTNANNAVRYAYAPNGKTVTFDDCKFMTTTYGIHFDGNAGGKVVVKDSTVTGFTTLGIDSEFTGCTFTKGVSAYSVCQTHADMAISNSTFTESWTDVPTANCYVGTAKAGAVVELSNNTGLGAFVGAEAGSIVVSDAVKNGDGLYMAGTFYGAPADIESRLAPGYCLQENDDGTYSIVERQVAQIGETTYPFVADAIRVAAGLDAEETVIKILENSSETPLVPVAKMKGDVTLVPATEGAEVSVTLTPTANSDDAPDTDGMAYIVSADNTKLRKFTIGEGVTLGLPPSAQKKGAMYIGYSSATPAEMVINGRLEAYLPYVGALSKLTVNPSGSIQSISEDLIVRWGATVDITGTGAEWSAEKPQGEFGYVEQQGGVVTLMDTYVNGGAWWNITDRNAKYADYPVTLKLNGSVLKVSGAFKLAANTSVEMDAASQIIAKEITNLGTIKVSVDGLESGTYKIIDTVGTGTLTLEDFGELVAVGDNAVGARFEVQDNDLVLVVPDPVAKIGEKCFATLEAALAAVEDGDTLTLLADVSMAEAIVVEAGAFTLDTNGKTIEFTDGEDALVVTGTADLTIVGDGKIVNSGDYEVGGYAVVLDSAEAALTLDGATLEGSWSGVGVVAGSYTQLSGTVIGYNAIEVGGEDCEDAIAVSIQGGQVETTDSDWGVAVVVDSGYIADEDFAFAISGGRFKGAIDTYDPDDLAEAISGGQFTTGLDQAWIGGDYELVDLGAGEYPYAVVSKTPVYVRVTAISKAGDAVTLTWEGSATGLYAVEYTDSLEEGSVDWQQASDPVTGVTVTLPGQTAAQRFYRVRVMTGVAK